jgi:hypothetical protein
MPASNVPLVEKVPAGRLLRHVVEATARAEELGAAPGGSVRILNIVALTLLDAGQLDTSRLLVDRALAIAQAQLGADHPDTLIAQSNLTYWLGESGQTEEAVSQLRRLLDDRIRVLGSDHPDTLITRSYLAYWLGKSGQAQEAVSQSRRLLEDVVRVLGPDHPHTLATRSNLARWLGASRQVGEAVSQLRRLLKDRVRVLGPDHPDTLATRSNLARWLGASGQTGEAVSQLRRHRPHCQGLPRDPPARRAGDPDRPSVRGRNRTARQRPQPDAARADGHGPARQPRTYLTSVPEPPGYKVSLFCR